MHRSIALVALMSATAAFGADDPWSSTFVIQAGAFRPDATTRVRLDPTETLPGTEVGLESDLGLAKKKTLPDLSFSWRFNERHGLEGSWVSLDREGSLPVDVNIVFGDVTFPINTTVNSNFRSDITRLAYRYSFVNQGGNELALLVGVHHTTFRIALDANEGRISESASVRAPLPTIGLRGATRIGDRWRVTGSVQALKLKVGDYDGLLVNATAGAEWAITRQLYAGLGYTHYRYRIDSQRESARGRFDFRFGGPALYAGWAF